MIVAFSNSSSVVRTENIWCVFRGQNWKMFAHASLSTQSAWHLARKYRLEQHIPNETLDFGEKLQLVFRYETVVFRRYVLALLLVGLLRKFEAYLVYQTLIWGKFPRRYSCFQKFRYFSFMFPGFPAPISDMRNLFSALSFQGEIAFYSFLWRSVDGASPYTK